MASNARLPHSVFTQVLGTAPAGTPTSMRLNAEADARMVTGLEHAMDGGYTADMAARNALLSEFYKLPASAREKIAYLSLGEVSLLNTDADAASRLFDSWKWGIDLAAPAGVEIPWKAKDGLGILTFGGKMSGLADDLAAGLTSAFNAALLKRLKGVSGLFFGAIARKDGNQGVGATANPSILMRGATDGPERQETFRWGVNNSGDWQPVLRVRPDTSSGSYSTAAFSGTTKYGAWNWLLAQWGNDTGQLDAYLNGALAATTGATTAITSYVGTGIALDVGRNASSGAAASQFPGAVHAVVVGSAKLTERERAALDALMMARRAKLAA